MQDPEVPSAGRSRGRKRSVSAKKRPEEERGRLKAHDPFELIRWLAYSQPDPRKALAELVQNSLDASAKKIRITRVREKGVPCLRILDDGVGVIPEMARPEALHYIATHVGHSRKRDLSPQQRLALMTQGQYGIGLLGFWSLGEMLEIRSIVPGQKPYSMILHRNSPDYQVRPLKGRLPIDDRWTEVVVAGLHPEAASALIGRRAADYLASELRGQLLSRDVEVLVEDRMARGRAPKLIPARPPRFLGERLEGIGTVEVPGYPPARLEVYLAGPAADGEEPSGLAVYSAGTLVAEGFHDLAALGLDHGPWTDSRLTGFVDFPAFQVAPGSRRGVLPDEAAGAFARAIAPMALVLSGLLESLEMRRTQELDRTLIKDLQRAFRDFYRQRPRYQMLPVNPERDPKAGPSAPDRLGASHDGAERDEAGGPSEDDEEPSAADGAADEAADEAPGDSANDPKDKASSGETPEDEALPRTPPVELLPPGPLDAVRLIPPAIRVQCGGKKRIKAEGVDAKGHAIDVPVQYSWELSGPVGTLVTLDDSAVVERALGENEDRRGMPAHVVLAAADLPGEGTLRVVATSGDRSASAEAAVEVLEEIGSIRSAEGIPQPEFVHEPGAGWRSRMVESRWQVNSGHREYRAIAERPVLKLRYLALLFAKEVVLRSSQDPRLEKPLEQLVEVAAYADRNLSERRGKRVSKVKDEGDA